MFVALEIGTFYTLPLIPRSVRSEVKSSTERCSEQPWKGYLFVALYGQATRMFEPGMFVELNTILPLDGSGESTFFGTKLISHTDLPPIILCF